MELNVNRNNKALQFYQHMGMRKLREGDFPIGNGYYMNDYIIVAPNRRGLPGFGVEWNEQISGDYGGQCLSLIHISFQIKIH